MNRNRPTDSDLSLDGRWCVHDDPHMSTTPIYLERVDPENNMARFYHLVIETDLFGEIVALRRWGRIGRSARQKALVCRSIADAVNELQRHAEAKRGRGYVDADDSGVATQHVIGH
jgi:predicted DNA-binding WGR domain protein